MERIASGLLEPFLTHLKKARDQIAKGGGYSIALEPDLGSDVTWFPKGTMERASHTIMVVFKHLIYEEKLQVDGLVGGITVAPAFILQQGSCKPGHVEVK